MLQLQTLNDILFTIADSRRDRAMLFQDAAGAWQPISSLQVYQRVRAVADTLRSWGIGKGDRVAILSENRWEWAVADFASLSIGAVDVPIYPNLLSGQIIPLLIDSGSRVLFVSTRAQLEKIAPHRGETSLAHIVLMDDQPVPGVEIFSSLVAAADAHGAARDSAFDQAAWQVQASDLATLIYTSGTTGEPKGVLLTHGNIASNVNHSLHEFDLGAADSCISFLPLSHITARHLDYALYAKNVLVAYCSSFDKLPQTLTAVRPTVLVAVPRVFEKVRQVAEQRASESAFKRRLFAWALATGYKYRDEVAAGHTPSSLSWKVADALVYKKLRAGFGGRVRYYIAGGAPLGLDTAHWFASAGIRILEGYGLTETSPVIALNTANANRMGSVGKPLPNVECRIAPDGELLVRGPSIFQGYWNNQGGAADSAGAVDEEGWFATGDIGHIDQDGFLFITDRKKELLKTSGGKLIAPQPIENKLKTSFLVGNVAVVGDRHKFASALIMPNFAALEAWARNREISVENSTADRSHLLNHAQVRAEFQSIVDRVNSTLANFETIKRFRLVADEWTVDSGELTPSMKLRRRIIHQKYAVEIAEFYADENTSHG